MAAMRFRALCAAADAEERAAWFRWYRRRVAWRNGLVDIAEKYVEEYVDGGTAAEIGSIRILCEAWLAGKLKREHLPTD